MTIMTIMMIMMIYQDSLWRRAFSGLDSFPRAAWVQGRRRHTCQGPENNNDQNNDDYDDD